MENFNQAESTLDILSNPEIAIEDLCEQMTLLSKTVFARMEYDYVFQN